MLLTLSKSESNIMFGNDRTCPNSRFRNNETFPSFITYWNGLEDSLRPCAKFGPPHAPSYTTYFTPISAKSEASSDASPEVAETATLDEYMSLKIDGTSGTP